MGTAQIDRVLAEIDAASAEAVAFTSDLVRIPTVNPPGEAYDDCAHLIGDRLERCAFEVEYFPAEGLPEHTPRHPRINVIGRHSALGDALVTGEVLLKLLGLLMDRGIRTLGEAHQASQQTYQARVSESLYAKG